MIKEKVQMTIPQRNYMYIAVSLLIIIVGFVVMSGGGAVSSDEFKNNIFSFSRTG